MQYVNSLDVKDLTDLARTTKDALLLQQLTSGYRNVAESVWFAIAERTDIEPQRRVERRARERRARSQRPKHGLLRLRQ
jgi:hypothetical protein